MEFCDEVRNLCAMGTCVVTRQGSLISIMLDLPDKQGIILIITLCT